MRTLDRAGVSDCVRGVGRPADALPEVAEIDLSPLLVTAQTSVTLDVRIRIAPVEG